MLFPPTMSSVVFLLWFIRNLEVHTPIDYDFLDNFMKESLLSIDIIPSDDPYQQTNVKAAVRLIFLFKLLKTSTTAFSSN